MEKLRNISSRQRNFIKYNDHEESNCGIFETSKQLRCLIYTLVICCKCLNENCLIFPKIQNYTNFRRNL